MDYKANDTLVRWWWPGQWLRIVYSVWFDQAWYWRNVRPRLHGRAQGWEIFVQGMLGTAIVALAVVAVTGALLAIAGIPIRWAFMVPTVALGMAVGMLFGILGIISRVATSLIAGMVMGMFMSVGMGVGVGLGVGLTQGAWWKIVFSNWSLVATAAILSVGIGVSQGIDNGRIWPIQSNIGSRVNRKRVPCLTFVS